MATNGKSHDNDSEQVRVFLWAPPRSLSTATAKCMSFVDGVQIWYEPYLFSKQNEELGNDVTTRWGNQLGTDLIVGPLAKEPRGNRIENDLFTFPWVKSQLETNNTDDKVVFIKDMAHAMHGRFQYLPTAKKFRHTFLIRDPVPMYASLRKLLCQLKDASSADNPTDPSDGDILKLPERIYKNTYDLWKYIKEHLDPNPVIIDSAELAAHPHVLLPKYFDAIGVPYKEQYLEWESSSDVTVQWKTSFQGYLFAAVGGVHDKALKSSCFIPEGPVTPRDSLPDDLIRSADAARPYYEEMFEQRIRP